MVFGITSKEETLLAHVKIEALKATITEANNGILFAYVAFGLEFQVKGETKKIQKIHYLTSSPPRPPSPSPRGSVN